MVRSAAAGPSPRKPQRYLPAESPALYGCVPLRVAVVCSSEMKKNGFFRDAEKERRSQRIAPFTSVPPRHVRVEAGGSSPLPGQDEPVRVSRAVLLLLQRRVGWRCWEIQNVALLTAERRYTERNRVWLN